MKSRLLGAVCACIFVFNNANAGLIDFESIPGGIPIEGLAINTQFLATEGGILCTGGWE